MAARVSNRAYSRLAASISPTDVTITLSAGDGAKFPATVGGDVFYPTLVDASKNLEIVKCTNRVGDVLTVVRGQDGTTARAYATGDSLELRVTAALIESKLDKDLYNSDKTALNSSVVAVANDLAAHLADPTAAHAASAISYAGSAGISATDVEGALDELDVEKAPKASPSFTGGATFAGTVTLNGEEAGFRHVPQNAKAAAYQLASADSGKHIYYTGPAAGITIPTNAADPIPRDSAITIVNNGSGNVTIVATGVNLYFAGTSSTGNRTLAPKGMVTLLKVGTDTWFISGAGLS